MRYKENWEASRKRLCAFWNQEIIDRCVISVTAMDDTYCPPVIPEDDEGRIHYWTDPEQMIARERYAMEHTYYAGDAIPMVWLNLGACSHAAFFKGEKHKFADTSVWFFPYLEEAAKMEFDENSSLYRQTLAMAKALVEDSRGDYMVSMPDTTGNSDALALTLGSEEMLMRMLEDPDDIHAGMEKLQYAYKRMASEAYEIIRGVNDGGSGIGWLNTWAPGFHAQLQCDLSVMISNSQFKEFIMPELREQSKFLEYPLYHFDGIEQIRHLDDLLSIPELRVIQWTQVAGQPPCTSYFPQLRKIQEAGKGVLLIVEPEQIRPVMENLSSKGLYLVTRAGSRDEADAIVKEVARLTHD